MAGKKTWKRDVIEVVLAFAAAWVFYQLLAIAVGTSSPIVSVASESMYHTRQFDAWWGDREGYYVSVGISRDRFAAFPNSHGLDKGDMLFVIKPENLRVGDIIVYRPGKGCFSIDETIVHRIIKTDNGKYTTKGDNNRLQDKCIVEKSQVEGKSIFAVPLFGYPRLILRYIFRV